MTPAHSIGERLRAARLAKHLSLTAVAAEAGVSAATLSRIETDKQNVDVSTLLTMCRIVAVSPADVLAAEAEETPQEELLVRELAKLSPGERAQIVIRASQAPATRRTARGDQLQERLDSLLSALDVLREELLVVQRQMRRK